MIYINMFSFFISLILSYIGLPMINKMLINSNTLCENYKGEKIPMSLGLLFVFVQSITISLIRIGFNLTGNITDLYLYSYIFMGLVGLLDDLIGDKKVKGLKGHIKSFFKGTLTTGAIKAGIGFFVSLYISILISKDVWEVLVNTFVIALFTNLINLFDLRPGRAIKVFITISLIFIFTNIDKNYNYIIYSLYGLILPYMSLDFKAKAMMGDVGSNIIGLTLGIICAVTYSFMGKIIILILLIGIHILAEKISFSKIIDKNPILKYIDSIGR